MHKLSKSIERRMAVIYKAIEALYTTYLKGKELVANLNYTEIEDFNRNHPDYVEMSDDVTEKLTVYFYLAFLLLAGCVDYFLFSSAIGVICELYGFSRAWKWLIPYGVIAIEVIVCYICTIKERRGEWSRRMVNVVKYFVFGILIGFAIFGCLYSFIGYRESSDGPFMFFALSTLLFQGFLLFASICLHLWIIRSAEDIALSIGYLWFKYVQNKKSANRKTKAKEIKSHHAEFAQMATATIISVDRFYSDYPTVHVDFSKAMPLELIIAVNKVMGREAIKQSREPDFDTRHRSIHE